MKLPNTEQAVIPAEKIRDYLLSPINPVGRYKAVFFRSLGYEQSHWQVLENDMRDLLSNDAHETETTQFGTKYVVRGRIVGPTGRAADIVSAWIILTGQKIPRFVTAYPGD